MACSLEAGRSRVDSRHRSSGARGDKGPGEGLTAAGDVVPPATRRHSSGRSRENVPSPAVESHEVAEAPRRLHQDSGVAEGVDLPCRLVDELDACLHGSIGANFRQFGDVRVRTASPPPAATVPIAHDEEVDLLLLLVAEEAQVESPQSGIGPEMAGLQEVAGDEILEIVRRGLYAAVVPE